MGEVVQFSQSGKTRDDKSGCVMFQELPANAVSINVDCLSEDEWLILCETVANLMLMPEKYQK